MQTPPLHPSWIILTALALGAVIDVVYAIPGAPEKAPETLPVGWSLTPTDFVRLGEHQKGLWSARAPQRVITQDTDLLSWLPADYKQDATLSAAPDSWIDLSFPTLASTPQLAMAQVFLAPTRSLKARKPCEQTSALKFQCAKQGWAYVGKKDLTIQGKKKTSCIWAHPVKGHTTTILYPPLTPPPGEQLQLEVAFQDDVTRDKPSPVQITVTHGAKPQQFTAQNTRRGWQKFAFASSNTPAPLQLDIQADKPGRHQLCYQLRTKKSGAASQ